MKMIDFGRYVAVYVALWFADAALALLTHDFSKYDGTCNTVMALGYVIVCAVREQRK